METIHPQDKRFQIMQKESGEFIIFDNELCRYITYDELTRLFNHVEAINMLTIQFGYDMESIYEYEDESFYKDNGMRL